MFKKLKKQIEENDTPTTSSSRKPIKVRSSPYTNNETKLLSENKWNKKCMSSVSLYSSRESISSNLTISRTSPVGFVSSPEVSTEESAFNAEINGCYSKEEIIGELGKRSAHIKRLENKITEMSAALEEQSTQKENLEDALQTMRQEIKNHAELTDKRYKKKITAAKDELEKSMRKKDIEFEDIIKRKDEEIAKNRRELLLENSRNVDVRDLTNLQQDEIGKMKQMLIHSQAEMTKKAAELFEKSKHLERLDKEYVDQKLVLEELQTRLDDLARERSKFEITERQRSMKISTLEKERDALKSQTNDALYELSEKSSSLEITQSSLRRAQEDVASLRETYKLYKIKVAEEKEHSISESEQLREKIRDLEQRLTDGTLSTTDQVKAFQTERELNESRLQEARNQLAENKTRSSEKINTLGSLVSSLDEQLKEKSKELREHKEYSDRQIIDYRKKVERLEEKLQDTEKLNMEERKADSDTIRSLKMKVEGMTKQLDGVREDNSDLHSIVDRAGYLEAQNKMLESRLRDATKRAEEEMVSSDGRIRELQKEIQMMSYQFENSNKSNVRVLEAKLEDQERRTFQYQKTIDELLTENEKLKETQRLNETSRTQWDVNLEQTKNLENKVQLLEEKLLEKEKEIKQVQEDDSEKRELKVENKALFAELENANKKLKTQQQKFTELKRACQKELIGNTGNVNSEDEKMQNELKQKKPPRSKKETNSSEIEVNFTYLKHVILKYMCSTNDQSRQLIGVISHLLQFSPREEIIVKDCMEWKLPLEKKR